MENNVNRTTDQLSDGLESKIHCFSSNKNNNNMETFNGITALDRNDLSHRHNFEDLLENKPSKSGGHHESCSVLDQTELSNINNGFLSPRSLTTTTSMSVASISDDMVENENDTLRDRVTDLEKRVHDQCDEITCLRATLADALRRINTLESVKGHVTISRLRREAVDGGTPHRVMVNGMSPPSRRPISASLSLAAGHGGSTTSSGVRNHVNNLESVSRRSGSLYQSTGSLHSDGFSSATNSFSPSASPSPPATHNMRNSPRGASGRLITPGSNTVTTRKISPLSTMGSLNGAKKWSSTSDFRDQFVNSPTSSRRGQTGSMLSLRSPFGSQQNLERSGRAGNKEVIYSIEEGLVRMHIRGRPVNLYVPTPQIETYTLSKVSPAPTQKLGLEWVYGYRGRDARSNLYLLPTGEMIYFVAAVVVLFNVEEHSQRHYLGHTEDIKCLTIHPNKLIVATGQATGHDRRDGKPHVRVWNTVSLQTLHIIGTGEFERSICCVSFSKADGGSMLLVVDEASDHSMSVWDWQRGENGSKITEIKCSNETVIAAEFHPLEAGVIVTCGRGHVNFWLLDSITLTLSRKTGVFDVRDKPKYVTCLAFAYTGDVLTGDSNGNVFIWGRGYNAVTKSLRRVHEGPIFSVCVLKDGSLVTGGGKDRRIVQFDSNYRKTGLEAQLPEHLGSIRTISQGRGHSQLLVGSTYNCILQGTFELSFQQILMGHVDDVWALATHPNQQQFLSVGYDKTVHLWDSLSHRSIWSFDLSDQGQTACFSCDGEVIVIGCIAGKWIVLDARTREVVAFHKDGDELIQSVSFSPNGKFLAIGARDNIIYLYQVSNGYRKYCRLGRCMGQSGSLTHLDWSSDSTYIRSNSSEYELLFWNAPICRQVISASLLRDTVWSTQRCVISFNTIGIFPESLDATELNTCARSHNSKLLATGDDFGKIKLYSYPVSQPKSLHHVNGGHSTHVTRVDFLCGDTRLISTGGRDTAIMQWTVS